MTIKNVFKIKQKFSVLILFNFLLLISSLAFADNVYFFGRDGSLVVYDNFTKKYELANNKVVGNVLGINYNYDQIYVKESPPFQNSNIYVFSLKDLNIIKKLPIEAISVSIRFILFPDSSKFIIQYLEPNAPASIVDVYDANTLEKVSSISGMPEFNKIMFSYDGSKLYSIVGNKDMSVDVFDVNSLEKIETIDISKFYKKKPDVTDSGLENYKCGKVLFWESYKTEQVTQYFVYNLNDGKLSSKISAPLRTKALFDRNSNRIIVEGFERVEGEGFKNNGEIYVFNLYDGSEVSRFNINNVVWGDPLGFSKSGDYFYYQLDSKNRNSSSVVEIDLSRGEVVNRIELPIALYSKIFVQ